MYLTTIRSCLAVTVLVTLIYVVGMSVFDTSMASHIEEGMGVTSIETEDRFLVRLLHALTTVVLVGPATLMATIMFRRSQMLNKELQGLVDRDRLTDVATRDFFYSKMEEHPTNYGVSLMVDIDNFKKINDTYGHLAGDQVIRHVAQILRKTVRPQDIVARFGGEEFIVFLAEQNSAVGFEVAERMRQNIAKDACNFDGLALGVTVSIGGSMKEAVDRIEQSIAEADDALYRAKQSGRNKTVFDCAPSLALKRATAN